MTRIVLEHAPSPEDAELVLATDLDGTFLGGTEAERRALYDWIETHRASVALIFVTGRDLPFIETLCGAGDAPWPDLVVGDVGTSVAVVDRAAGACRPHPPIEAEIARRWGCGVEALGAVLEAAAGLSPQAGPFRYRMSYHYDPERFDQGIVARIEAAGFDCLISDDRFLDVLPRGVSKGPTLMRVLEALDADPERVLVAGDTLNDLSLFETGLKGVAVGGGEPALIARLRGRENVHFAAGEGAAGVAEAIAAFALHPTPPAPLNRRISA